MSLHEQIKKEEEELAQLEKIAEGEADKNAEIDGSTETDDVQEDDDSEISETTDEEEATGDELPPPEEEEEANQNSIAAQLRIERKQRKQLEAENDRLRQEYNSKQSVSPESTEPSQKTLTTEERLQKIEEQQHHDQLINAAISEFSAIEEIFSKDTPDYEGASSHMIGKMIQGVKYSNPGIAHSEALSTTKRQILHLAARAQAQGLNPAEALYKMSFEHYGYEGKQNTPNPKTSTDRLKKIQNNQKRSATSLSGGGQPGSSTITLEEAGNMDLGSFSNLSEAEMDRLIAGE